MDTLASLTLHRSPETMAVRSRTGTKVHRMYVSGGPTFCGVRFPAVQVDASKVSDDKCCEKCFPRSA